MSKVGSPHNGYTIVTSMNNNTFDGTATIYTPDNRRIVTFTYEEEEVVNGNSFFCC